MASYIDPAFRESLLKKVQDRTAQDLTLINAHLKSLEALSSLKDTTIRSLCKTVHYQKHEANDVLYKSGDVITCWYILLSGSVFIDGSMFLPRSGFGRRSAGQQYRIHDCLVLETSEMLVIDYPQQIKPEQPLQTHQIQPQLVEMKHSNQPLTEYQPEHQQSMLQVQLQQPPSITLNSFKSIKTTTTSSNSRNMPTAGGDAQVDELGQRANFVNMDSRSKNGSSNLTTFKSLATASISNSASPTPTSPATTTIVTSKFVYHPNAGSYDQSTSSQQYNQYKTTAIIETGDRAASSALAQQPNSIAKTATRLIRKQLIENDNALDEDDDDDENDDDNNTLDNRRRGGDKRTRKGLNDEDDEDNESREDNEDEEDDEEEDEDEEDDEDPCNILNRQIMLHHNKIDLDDEEPDEEDFSSSNARSRKLNDKRIEQEIIELDEYDQETNEAYNENYLKHMNMNLNTNLNDEDSNAEMNSSMEGPDGLKNAAGGRRVVVMRKDGDRRPKNTSIVNVTTGSKRLADSEFISSLKADSPNRASNSSAQIVQIVQSPYTSPATSVKSSSSTSMSRDKPTFTTIKSHQPPHNRNQSEQYTSSVAILSNAPSSNKLAPNTIKLTKASPSSVNMISNNGVGGGKVYQQLQSEAHAPLQQQNNNNSSTSSLSSSIKSTSSQGYKMSQGRSSPPPLPKLPPAALSQQQSQASTVPIEIEISTASQQALQGLNEQDTTSASSEQLIKEAVKEVLEKDPKERTEEDIDILFEFMQNFPAFSDLTQPIIRELCSCMVLGVVDKADTIVLDHNERLDSWAVVLNGYVECTLPDSTTKAYHVGDYFGVDPTLEPVYHEGIMRTKCDDCQFVLVKQNDYFEILNKSKESLNRHTENGMVVMITEPRPINAATERTGEIILKASAGKLLEHLICDDVNSIVDPTYIQDFLLTYRVFIDVPTKISNKLYEWFVSPPSSQNTVDQLKKKVYRIVLEWITNHFNDFENNRELYDFAERFQETLSKDKMLEQFRVLTIAISTKSKPRTVTLARSKRDELLAFSIQGGWDKGYGIYVSRVDKDSKAFELGIRKGDQIVEVNGQSFQHITYLNALDTLKSYTHLSITLKYNPIGFNEMLLHPEKSPYRNKKNVINNTNQNRAYLIEYLQRQQDQFQQSLTSLCNDGAAASSENNMLSSMNAGQSSKPKSIGSVLPPLPPGSSNQVYSSNGQLAPPATAASGFILPQSSASSMSSLSSQQNYLTAATTPRNKSNGKDGGGLLGNGAANGSSSSLASHFQKPTHRFRKALEKFNRNLKPYSKDLASITAVDSSAPSLKSITRSPSPSLSNFSAIYASANMNSTSSITNLTGGAQQTNGAPGAGGSLYRNTSTGNLSANEAAGNDASSAVAAAAAVMSASLASISLEDQQQFVGEHVLKIYKNDQNFKYLVVHKETSTKEVVMLALNEFNIVDDVGSSAYSLCEVSVDQDRLIKQKRLPDQMNNLAEKLPLNARYYLKSNTSPEQFLSDSFAAEELLKDANISFLQLDPLELSAQLTLRDYCVFKSIESSEYIDFLYKKRNPNGDYTHLQQIFHLSNEEMFWVVHEILHESSAVKRAKIIKHFIQIAHICKECKNFNSSMAILSGLDHLTVTRLRETWEKVSPKYKKLFDDLKLLLDPSNNMRKYRNLLKSESIQPPIIPFFPLCQKDLTFIQEPGETIVDGLVNFEKLRKLSKSVRSIVQMTASSFDLTSLKDVPTSHSIIFTMFGCSNSTLLGFRSNVSGGVGSGLTKLNMKTDHIKRLYEESVMVRKVRHYLNNVAKVIETNEERLRIISHTLESSNTMGNTSANYNGGGGYNFNGNSGGGSTTLRRKMPSPNSSLGGSISSINGLLNNSLSHHNLSNASSTMGGGGPTSAGICSSNLANGAGISTGNGTLTSTGHKGMNPTTSLFGTHSPDAVKKLLSLSENTKTKTVKSGNHSQIGTSASSLNSHLNTSSRFNGNNNNSVNSLNAAAANNTSCLSANATNLSNLSSGNLGNTSGHSASVVNSTFISASNITAASSPKPVAASPKLKQNPQQQPSSKYTVHSMSNENSNVSAIKLNAVKLNGVAAANCPCHHQNLSVNGQAGVALVNGNSSNTESDSGRASMASNIDQDQYSPTFQQRNTNVLVNRYLGNGDHAGTNQSSFKAKMQSSNISLKKAPHAACCMNGQPEMHKSNKPTAPVMTTSSSSSSSSMAPSSNMTKAPGAESGNLEEEDQVSAV